MWPGIYLSSLFVSKSLFLASSLVTTDRLELLFKIFSHLSQSELREELREEDRMSRSIWVKRWSPADDDQDEDSFTATGIFQGLDMTSCFSFFFFGCNGKFLVVTGPETGLLLMLISWLVSGETRETTCERKKMPPVNTGRCLLQKERKKMLQN